MARWEWVPTTQSKTKNIDVKKTLPNPSTGAYGPDVIYDDTKPDKFITLRAKGMTATEFAAEEAKLDVRGALDTYAFTRGSDSLSFTGKLVQVDGTPVDLGCAFYDVEIKLRKVDS